MRIKTKEKDRAYSLLKTYVDFLLHRAYRKIEYVGVEKIPQNSAVIYAPNHTNALMDALVVLAMDEKPKVFVARADIFRNPKLARILYFLRMMPIMRSRDGMEEVKKNDVTIHESARVLKDGVPFCILPEGTHRAKHSLLPLGKGIFRIALEAQELLKDEMPLYIVPLGLEYGSYWRFRSTALVRVGDPINVREVMEAHPELTRPELMNIMKADLAGKMKELILYIPDDEKYEPMMELTRMESRKYMLRTSIKDGSILVRREIAGRQIVEDVMKLREEKPEAAEKLLSIASKLRERRQGAGISALALMSRVPAMTALWRLFLLVITCWYTIPMGILTLPLVGLSSFLHTKMRDNAFFNSIRFASQMLAWPILLIIYGIVLFVIFDWEWALVFFILLVPAYHWCHDASRSFRLMMSDIKITSDSELRRMLKDCRKMYSELIG